MTVDTLTSNLPTADIAVITGGEPLMQQDKEGWPLFLRTLKSQNYLIHVETNGTIKPNSVSLTHIDYFTVSPKPPSAVPDPKTNTEAMPVWRHLAASSKACFKFVAADHHDLTHIRTFTTQHRLSRDTIWVMPEGADRDTHLTNLQTLADPIIANGWNISTRLHVLAWNTERNR